MSPPIEMGEDGHIGGCIPLLVSNVRIVYQGYNPTFCIYMEVRKACKFTDDLWLAHDSKGRVLTVSGVQGNTSSRAPIRA